MMLDKKKVNEAKTEIIRYFFRGSVFVGVHFMWRCFNIIEYINLMKAQKAHKAP